MIIFAKKKQKNILRLFVLNLVLNMFAGFYGLISRSSEVR